MALDITAAGAAKLIISGTATELPTCYARINFDFGRNGADSYGKLSLYADKVQYDIDENILLVVDNFSTQHTFTIDTAVEEQSLLTGHEKIKTWLEGIGYTVAIVDL